MKNVLVLLFLPFSLISNQKIISKFHNYPHGLLTDDFGILSENDLKLNADRAGPVPYSLKSFAYEYWQCFPVENITFFCEYFESDNPNELLALTHIKAELNGYPHEYISRRPWDASVCHDRVKQFQDLVANITAACISGSFPLKEDKNISWTFGRFKTKNGCVSYFERQCWEE